jgi:hypothetical protein
LKINNEFADAQQAFDMSEIPITLQIWCQPQELDVQELSAGQVLRDFELGKGKWPSLGILL